MNHVIRKSLVVGAIQLATVASLGAKLLVDRATRPRVWGRTAPADPNLPIRGRYVSLRIEAAPGDGVIADSSRFVKVALSIEEGQLIARAASESNGMGASVIDRDGRSVVRINQPLAYFIPEHVIDPSVRQPGEELWVEVTLPRAGAPRPIGLGVKKDGVLTPLEID